MKINKKVLSFALVGVLALMLVSAALVGYLSNSVQAGVTVDSPLALQVSVGSGWGNGPVIIPATFGGNTFTYWQQVKNNANVEIVTDMTTVITNNLNNVDCVDFTEMLVIVTKNTHDPTREGNAQDVLTLCSDKGQHVTVVIPSNYQASETEEYRLDITFATAVEPSTYTINTIAKI